MLSLINDQYGNSLYQSFIEVLNPKNLLKFLLLLKNNFLEISHSHNGTIRIPFLKYPLIKEENAIKYNQDYYKLNSSELYISSGLGSEKGIRLFCRPSINFFRLSNKS